MTQGRKRIFPDYAPRFTGYRPSTAVIVGNKFPVKSWRDILLKTCELVLDMKPSEFNKILELKGTKTPWFSRESNALRDPIKIRGSNIFAETHANANGLVLRALHVLKFFSLKPKIDITLDN
jgi:hypothetical protein